MGKEYFIHESSYIDEGAKVGKGTRIWHFTHILKGAVIGEDCTIGQSCTVENGAVLGNRVKIQNNVSVYGKVTVEDDVFLGPSMVFTNDINPRAPYPKHGDWVPTLVRHGASIGANATIVCGITIGRWAFIGAGSVVTKNVPDYAIAFGSPAVVHGYMCECGEKMTDMNTDSKEGHSYKCKCGRSYIMKNGEVYTDES